jgi:RHS repeat-associated protein
VKRTDSIGGTSRSIQYGYDVNSNQTSVTTASGITAYSYDERDRLDVTKFNGAIVADYDYDAGNRLTKTTFGNGTEEVRVYDNLNRLKELTSKKGAIDLSRYVYTIDKVGNRKTATESVNGQARSIAYTYDDLYRLTEEAIVDAVNGNRTSGYTYDNVGNRSTKTVNGVTTTYAYDGNDRLLNEKVGGAIVAEYSYDNNGSTLTKTENGVTTTYNWNDEKRLISATVGTQTVDYVYNDQGIRVSSKQGGVEKRYLLDEGIVANVWEEYAADGTVQASYVYGNDLITQTQAGQTSYYLVDGLGSTRLLTDTQGQVLNSYGYEAFGQTVSQSGNADNKYQYAGEQFDAALGDYYLRQRFYDTSSGRFGRMDTWEGKLYKPSTLHKYTYAHNNSVNWIDPSGYYTLTEVMATSAIIGALVGGSIGAYYGTQQSGKFFSYDTLKYALVGAIGGAAAGAMLGGAIYLTPAGLGPIMQTGLRQLLIKASGAHSTTAVAMISGFGIGFTAGILEPDYAVGLGSAATTAFSVLNDGLVRGAIWRRHLMTQTFGSTYMTVARPVLIKYTQAATFITAGFFFGFTIGYWSGARLRTAYDEMYAPENR